LPEPGPALGLADGRWFATYFRLAMGFDGTSGKLAWVRLHGSDFLGGGVGPGAIVLCDEQGKATAFDAKSGGVLAEMDLGEPLKACVVNVDGARFEGTPTEVKPLAEQLSEAVLVEEPQLVVAQKLLLRELAALEPETATQALVDLASDPRTSPDLLAEARTALANRRNGASFMEAALARHYDFLHDVLRSPPVGPIAQAIGAMKQGDAAPLLAAHLLDPADTNDDVMRAAAALAIIGTTAEVPVLRQFFGMYRATAADDDLAAAVVSVGQALLDLDDKVSRGAVVAAATDPTTIAYARERLQAVVAEERQAEATAAAAAPVDAPKGQAKKNK
jgi:outer membrane protein assembly factor BamB